MRLLLILAVLGLVVAVARRPSYPEAIRCQKAGGRCMARDQPCKYARLNVKWCGGGDERICCLARVRKEHRTGQEVPEVESRSARGAEDLDLVNRDPNNIHGSL